MEPNSDNRNHCSEQKDDTKDPLEPVFLSGLTTPKKKDTEESSNLKPLSYFQLFRYATCGERFLVLLGLLLAILTSLGLPFIIILYGEFSTLLVFREMANGTIAPVEILSLFGGGRVIINNTPEERKNALLEDSAAFALGFTSIGVVQFILGVLTIACLNYAAQSQIGRIRKLFLRAVFRQDMGWCDTHNTATFASRLTEDLDKLQEGIGEKLGIFLYLLMTFVNSSIMAFIQGWKLTLVVFSCSPIIIIATAVMTKVQTSLTAKELESYGEAGSVVEEVISAIRTVVAFDGQEKEVDRYTEKLGPAKAAGLKRGIFSGLGGGIMWLITYCSYAIAFWYGVELIISSREDGTHEYTPAILIIVLFGVLSGAMNMGMASPHIESFSMARGSAAVVFDVLSQVPEIDSLSDSGMKPASLQGDIQMTDVHFSYPARPAVPVLQGLSLTIRHGETVALVGSSGGGKSTVVQLIQRLYDPLHGGVYLDGLDVRQLNVGWLRNHIGVVGQEPVLFGTTISENIRYGREVATQQDIEEAAKQANAHEFISKLPQGYNTLVGERGAQLSGGQKQRIAIARALVRKPAILLLDEATSALDVHSEAKVQSALDEASKGRTTIIVAHRLSTIRNADRIVFLAAGQVVEQGSHKELMELKGHYWAQVNAETVLGKDESQNVEAQAKTDIIRRQSTQKKFKSNSDSYLELLKELEKEPEYKASYSRIMGVNKPEWLFIVIGCIAAAAVGSALPGFAVLFGEVYGVLSIENPDEVRQQTSFFCIMFVVIGIVTGIGTFLQMYLFSVAGVRLTNRLRILAMKSILKQEIGWFDEEQNSVGALCARLSSDAAGVQGATGIRIGTILQAGSTMVIGILLGMYYSWKMTLVSLISVPLVFGGVFLESRIIQSQGLHEKEALEAATKIAVEGISNLRTVASLGAESLFLSRYETALAVCMKATRKKTRLRGVVFSLGQTAPFFGYALSLYYGGVLVATEGLPYKNIIKVSEALIFGSWMLGQALAFVPSFSGATLSAGRIFKLVDRIPRIQSTSDKTQWEPSSSNVKYSDVHFSYPTRPEVTILRNLNLAIPHGKTVALVGPSGCGKSTCVQLIQRLYDPGMGNLTIDNTDIRDVPLKNLRAQLGLVSQEPVLFDRTIADNIAYGDNSRTVPIEEIIDAAKKANIHNFISSLPLGYETRLGSKGTQLSGGQKQRVAIARALVRNPRILLLDEATSALDTQSQKVVQEALDQAREGRTCVTIAHRLATVQQADIICVLHNGAVAEMGSHTELLALGGRYCQLLRDSGGH